jgi:hypothetical protein
MKARPKTVHKTDCCARIVASVGPIFEMIEINRSTLVRIQPSEIGTNAPVPIVGCLPRCNLPVSSFRTAETAASRMASDDGRSLPATLSTGFGKQRS